MIYREALAWLYGTQRFGIKLGLENVHRLFQELKVPNQNQRIIHVAGTNGKGSVCAMIDSISRAGGYRTGLFTSPHLVTYRERIRVTGEMISPAEVADGLTAVRNLIKDWDPHPTFFEITTALALIHFKNAGCDLLVLETGLGGRLDATNAAVPVVSVLTPIGYDHEKWLGHTLEAIAGEKAGIIKPHVPVVSAVQEPAAEEVIRARATECDAPLEFVAAVYSSRRSGAEADDRRPDDNATVIDRRYNVALAGKHQQQNAALAVAALRAGKIRVTDDAVARGLASVEWPARFQRWDERTVIDGAHNPGGAQVLVETWREQFGADRATIVLAVLRDKNVAEICRTLAPIGARFILPQIRTERALTPAELAPHLSSLGLAYSISQSFSDALESARAHPEPVLITGSLHFAGEALATLNRDPDSLEDCAQ